MNLYYLEIDNCGVEIKTGYFTSIEKVESCIDRLVIKAEKSSQMPLYWSWNTEWEYDRPYWNLNCSAFKEGEIIVRGSVQSFFDITLSKLKVNKDD